MDINFIPDFHEAWNGQFLLEVRFSTEGVNERMADWCEKIIVAAKQAYYTSGQPMMEDATYDKFENRLRYLRASSPVLESVGYDIHKIGEEL